MTVNKYRTQDTFPKKTAASQTQKTNLFVSGLPFPVTEEEVRKMFTPYGAVKSVYLKNPIQTNEQQQNDGARVIQSLLPLNSIAYVNMETEEAAMKAFEIGKKGSKVKISFYQAQNNLIPRAEKVQDHGVVGNTHYRVLFVTKINKRVTEEQLIQTCGKHGKVLSCKLHMGADGFGNAVSLGKAIVTYASTDDASNAMKKLYFEDSLGQYLSIDFYKNRELRTEQKAQKSDFAQTLTQIAQTVASNQSYGYGYRGGYQNRGHQGYQNNQRQ